jgi:hypothetical protein
VSRAREVDRDTRLSLGARTLYHVLLHAQARADRRAARSGNPAIRAGGGGPITSRAVGRSYLAARVGRSVRSVTRYVRELREFGYVIVIPPVLALTAAGWRTVGTNRYILLGSEKPSEHRHRRRSRRGDTVDSAAAFDGAVRATPPAGPPSLSEPDAPAPPVDHAVWAAEVRAILMASRKNRRAPP